MQPSAYALPAQAATISSNKPNLNKLIILHQGSHDSDMRNRLSATICFIVSGCWRTDKQADEYLREIIKIPG